jgi:aspartyl-tRNA(Asn)/glutamyl-tRNA(Gln) amidotransferase subunit A
VLDELTIEDAARMLRAGEVSSEEMVAAGYAKADQVDAELGIYLSRFDTTALPAARTADRELREGVDRGPLHGIPIGIKDIMATVEGPTTGQSLVHDHSWFVGRDACVIARLRAAGAIITGKLTTMELAVGLPDASKPFPIPKNPWNPDHWAGGSSSGAASGVAAGVVLGAVGTDTGGSIRMPAAFCGVSGFKPTYGLVPVHGVIPLARSLDHVGPLARSARGCALMLAAMAEAMQVHVDTGSRLNGVRVGIERVHHLAPGAETVAAQVDAVGDVLRALGATVVDVVLDHYPETTIATMLTLSSEGLAQNASGLRERWTDYFAATRTTLALGAVVSGADYVQAQRVRDAARRALHKTFGRVDVVVGPTATMTAPTSDELAGGPTALMSSVFTPFWSGVGNPALAVPMGFASNGLPLSVQIAGRFGQDDLVLRVGEAYQRQTDWHRMRPATLHAYEGTA